LKQEQPLSPDKSGLKFQIFGGFFFFLFDFTANANE
jgi:hypothetical protein